MRDYANKSMGVLAAELAAGLRRLRKGYIDSAEDLMSSLDAGGDYPHEFVVYRLTGYRRRGVMPPAEPLPGESLRADLQLLMLDLCDSFILRVSDYTQKAFDTEELAERFSVSTKTIQRWRRRSLPARRLVFADGKRRMAFLADSVDRFIRDRGSQIQRSTKFTQMTESERDEIVRGARKLAAAGGCRLADVVRNLADQTGRAAETIRYTIRRHDLEHRDDAIFPYLTRPLNDSDKQTVYHAFLRGVSVGLLSKKHRRTKGSIYRIINEMRARQLLNRPISYVYNPEFDLPNSEQEILQVIPRGTSASKLHRPPPDLPPYLRALYTVPLLDREGERDLFRRYNYVKFLADQLRRKIDITRVRTGQLKKVEAMLLRANAVKNQIVRANLRLVVSIAKKHITGPQTLFELISDGNFSIMRAVEKFDYARGFRFSTYASWAIMRNFARSVPKERYQLDRFSTGCDEVLEIAAGLRSYQPHEINISELRESLDVVLAQLTPTERSVVIDHYGLDQMGKVKTLEQLAKRLSLSKERVRQIEIQAMKKLRKLMRPDGITMSV